ncbi:MAG: DUF5337 family protein [Pseudomonadota bacterium]
MAQTEEQYRRQGRAAALVIAGSGLAAIFAPLLGLPPRFEILILLAALAGFTWAMIVLGRLWLAQRKG